MTAVRTTPRLSRGLRPMASSAGSTSSSPDDTPLLKGIKTTGKDWLLFLHRPDDAPHLKGIKTRRAAAYRRPYPSGRLPAKGDSVAHRKDSRLPAILCAAP